MTELLTIADIQSLTGLFFYLILCRSFPQAKIKLCPQRARSKPEVTSLGAWIGLVTFRLQPCSPGIWKQRSCKSLQNQKCGSRSSSPPAPRPRVHRSGKRRTLGRTWSALPNSKGKPFNSEHRGPARTGE